VPQDIGEKQRVKGPQRPSFAWLFAGNLTPWWNLASVSDVAELRVFATAL